MKSIAGTVGAAVAAFIAAAGGALAQTPYPSYADAFAARIENPTDNAVLSAFVTVAVRNGQYDQAISSVEQYLINYPRDARARLTLGRLYNHIGSYELARRQLNHAIAIGDLSAPDDAEAHRLLARVERSIKGTSGSISFTAGIRSEWTDFEPGGAQADYNHVAPYGMIQGYLRQDLHNATADALIFSGSVTATERFFTRDLSMTGSSSTYVSGGASVTYDKGLPNSGIDSLRLLVSAFATFRSFDSMTRENGFGVSGRFVVRPSVETTAFVGGGWVDLSGSQGIFTDERWFYEAGITQRVWGGQAIGLKISGAQVYLSGFGEVGHVVQGEIRYGGVVWERPDVLVWSHQLAFAVGHGEGPDLSIGPGTTISSDFWRVSSEHDFQLNERNKVSFEVGYGEIDYDILGRDRSTIDMLLSYTLTLN
ncbi:MAG: tetratricopeptide repeat protein [Flavobacteriaceae bacterium]